MKNFEIDWVIKKRYLVNFLIGICTLLNVSCRNAPQEMKVTKDVAISVLTAANSWANNDPAETKNIISERGISNWSKSTTKIRTYFKLGKIGTINIALKAKAVAGKSSIKLTFNGVTKVVDISKADYTTIFVGTFLVDQPGYVYVEMQGLNKTGEYYADVSEILIGGEATEGDLYYIKDDFYWGRRGPSVHLSYKIPEEAADIVWFYNEMTIPTGEDVIGSYFMANGFGEGYFGIQVNSEVERRILFSVWSPFKTDDPSSIPEDQKIILLAKGENVITKDFGGEGAGGQSRKVYNWKAGDTYKFLLKGSPSDNNSTDFTAYFYAPETDKWELIASFRRPKTSTYLTRPHSFLENFNPAMGNESRKVIYGNQWVCDRTGKWFELTKAKFTADATARKDARLDYEGGDENKLFYLKNCGFFSTNTVIDSEISRVGNGIEPTIDFESLPN